MRDEKLILLSVLKYKKFDFSISTHFFSSHGFFAITENCVNEPSLRQIRSK